MDGEILMESQSVAVADGQFKLVNHEHEHWVGVKISVAR
jgi:hypothetical protein